MIELKEIKEQAISVKILFSKCKTLEDLRNLRHFGYQEHKLQVEVDENEGLIDLSDALQKYQDWNNTEFLTIRADTNDKNLDYLTYHKDGDFYFDVFDKEIDEEYAFIEDATLDTIDEMYEDALKELEEERE